MGVPVYLYLAALFGATYFTKIICQAIKLPEVTGYVLLGVLLGAFGIFNEPVLGALEPMSTVALGIFAFLIGAELKFEVIGRMGKAILFIVFFETVGAFGVVLLLCLTVGGMDINMSLLLGAVASATAPAATVAIIQQYQARGPLTSTILAVVGIDDAVALVLYVFAESFVSANLLGADLNIATTFGGAGLTVLLSVLAGLALAGIFLVLLRRVKNNDWILFPLTCFILLQLGIADAFGLSELLSIMVFAMVVANAAPALARKAETIIRNFSPVFLAAFFVLSGAHLDLSSIAATGLLALLYFFSRAVGKLGGAALGAAAGGAEPVVRKWIGTSLLPQVGVALALTIAVRNEFMRSEYGEAGQALASTVISILLATTVLTEIIGPLLTRTALTKAGEVGKA